MNVKVVKKAVLQGIPSASGVEIINGIIYVIGDDSASLFVLDHSLKLLSKVELYIPEKVVEGRIPKKLKADLECMTALKYNGNDYLLVMGSGSTDKRNKGFVVKLPTKFNKKYLVNEFDFSPLYNLLKSNRDLCTDGVLNIEGLATSEDQLVLLLRGNKAGKNCILYFSLEEFLPFVIEDSGMVPFPTTVECDVPSIKNVPAGFTGASVFDDKLFITCSAEDTSDPVLDGVVTGSMIGVRPLDKLNLLKGDRSVFSGSTQFAEITDETGQLFPIKVESVSVYEKEEPSTYIAIAVTDDDAGGSEILMVEITL